MARRVNRWGWVLLTLAGVMGAPGMVAAQFNPYVMPRFNPASPAATSTLSTAAVTPNYLGGYDPYGSSYNPYYGVGPVGGVLFGQADTWRAYGQTLNYIEQARIMREQSIQARFDTQRRRFELDMYIRANTPTFTDEQNRIARLTLKRIHTHSTPAEIASAKALNVMLEDARKFPGRKAIDQIILSEDILAQLNVTATFAGLGVLRNGGRINWPLATQEVLTADQRKTLEVQAQSLLAGAQKGKIDPNVFRDFSNELDRTYEGVLKRVNEIPGPQYLETKRFLNDLKDARTALEKGEAQWQMQYDKFIAGGKSVNDVVEFMIGKGLSFAPAAAQDEPAYRAFYSALVAFDVALNTQGPPPAVEPKVNSGNNK